MEGSEPNRAADGRTVNKEDVLRDFQASFFAMSGLASFPWTFLEKDLERNKSSDLISDILSQTCLHSLCRRFPPSARYRKLFLSQLITREAAGCDPLDALYDALAEVVGAGYPTECFKSYLLPGGEAISLLESVALVSDGTTGLLTWEAALHLAEWALDHRHPFTGRTVLELGSGAGLTGIAICRSCSPSRYVFSDCHPRVLRKLRDNVRLNGLTGPEVGVEEMDWTTATDEQIARIGADTVIAADVVYDPDVVESLVALLSRILRVSSPEVFICSTVRNQETYGGFKRRLGKGAELPARPSTDPMCSSLVRRSRNRPPGGARSRRPDVPLQPRV
ncbi:protein-lysine N-methyltransferase EEF2KMT isoform X2 [Pseudoliparis swirei]|uniref:protein-lysine N-methyltransferase EEF2KMT isoform X2 n=1 Tax=Pseudoliparis swirei TaxID=2059687 RepID=UPI0024BEEB55|nr:protein-lysine N-methyltransferase EEF2KMT isoform X2 [Pseudoliparis swirei]